MCYKQRFELKHCHWSFRVGNLHWVKEDFQEHIFEPL